MRMAAADARRDAPAETGSAGRPFDPTPWRNELLGFVRRLGAGGDAEDVVQDALLRAISNPPRSHARAWLYRAALSAWSDRRRRALRQEAVRLAAGLAGVGPGPAAPPDDGAVARQLADAAWEAARTLPERQRLALELRFRRHMDYDEIAVALDCTAATARQHFHLAVKAVRDRLGIRPHD